jgi:hypothetical protein
MKGRRSIVVVENFYDDPDLIHEYALRQVYYLPYQTTAALKLGEKAKWWTSRYKTAGECPFKSSDIIIQKLEGAVGEKIDREHWNNEYPVDNLSKPITEFASAKNACLWNCSFHAKLHEQPFGSGVHNHVTDIWNPIGEDGWSGLIYMSHAGLEAGIHLWNNVNPRNQYEWMTPRKNWLHVDRFGNNYNRLLLVRGNIPSSGINGSGTSVLTGRLFQTFFFKTVPETHKGFSVRIPFDQ